MNFTSICFKSHKDIIIRLNKVHSLSNIMKSNGIFYSIIPFLCFMTFSLFYRSEDMVIDNTEDKAKVASKTDEENELFQTCMNYYKEVNQDDKFVEGTSIWIDEDGVKLICNILNPRMRVLEYGSGGSTTMFSNFVSKWKSIEHDQKWGEKMKIIINDLKLKDFELF